MDIQTGASKEIRLNESVEACSVQRHQSTENWSSDTTPLDALKLAVSCPDHFKIISSSGAVLFSTSSLNYQKNGGVSSFFKSGSESSSFIIQFEDNSLHFIGGEPDHLSLKWSREEGLSSIKQLEIFDPSSDNRELSNTFDYIKAWDQGQTLDQIPQKIILRYVENMNHLVKLLFSTKQISEEETISTEIDIYGFKKTFIALTNFGKVISFSSYNGALQWTSGFSPSSNPLKQILMRKTFVGGEGHSQT